MNNAIQRDKTAIFCIILSSIKGYILLIYCLHGYNERSRIAKQY